jgi:riboflavin kinase/FMN adenylyltransferase
MKIYTAIPHSLPSVALTIGMFDGLHLGHAALLNQLKSKKCPSAVLTFVNHPSKVLQPTAPPKSLLTSFAVKLALLEKIGIDHTVIIPFTLEFAATPFEDLLSRFSLSHLVLGQGSTFGRKRTGTEENIRSYANKHRFAVEYVPKTTLDGKPISSSRIRDAIHLADFSLAEKLLGRPYAILFPANTTHYTPTDLCLPPDGAYPPFTVQKNTLSLPRPLATETLIPFNSSNPETDHD